MTKVEAAAVADIGMAFTSKSISHFDEFEYFTSVKPLVLNQQFNNFLSGNSVIVESVIFPPNFSYQGKMCLYSTRIRRAVFKSINIFTPGYVYAYNNRFECTWVAGWEAYVYSDLVPAVMFSRCTVNSGGTLYVKPTATVEDGVITTLESCGCTIHYTL